MKIQVNDFVLLDDRSTSKPVLAKVKKKEGKIYHGNLSIEKCAIYGEETYEVKFESSDIVANLGPEPAYGKVYKTDIEPYYGVVNHKLFKKPIGLMVDLDEEEEKTLIKSLNSLGRAAKKYGFLKYIRNIFVVLRPGLTKTAGTWSVHKEEGEKITIFLPRTETAFKALLPMDYIFFHEIGHHLWNLYMKEEEKAKWFTLYHKAVNVEEISASTVTRMRAHLEEAGSIQSMKKSLDEDDSVKFNEILKQTMKAMSIKADEVNSILATRGNLSKYWITTPIQRSDSKVLITEYARKNSQELFCECVAHLLADLEMPEKLQKRTTNMVKRLAKRGPHDTVKSITVTG